MEEQPNQEGSIENLLSEIDKHLRDGNNEHALKLIESLPNGEEKYYRFAYIGHNYVDVGDLERAQEIVDLLEKEEDSLPYAGGVLELILRKNGDITDEEDL